MAAAAPQRERAARHVAAEVAGVLRRHPVIAILPAAVMGAGSDAIVLVRHEIGLEILFGLLLALLFQLYVGLAELVMLADRSRRPMPGAGALARRAVGLAPRLLLASIPAMMLPLAASGLLVVPGFWLLTRWSLFAPAIVRDGLAPVAALRKSASLVDGAFWWVAGTATAAVILEHVVVHATVHAEEPAFGSVALSLVGAALATAIVSPPAAFMVSVVYERRRRGG